MCWAGYVVGIALLVRLAWGIVGPRYARFSDFVRGPGPVFGYLRDLVLFRARRYLGHSPGGGAMVVALLLCLAVTVVTGLVLYGDENHAGPLAPLFAGGAARPIDVAATPAAAAERVTRRPGTGKSEDKTLEEVHELFANLTLALIVLHIAGVLLASLVHRENLVWAMITGDKRPVLPDSQ